MKVVKWVPIAMDDNRKLLGMDAKDKITGFKGVVIAVSFHLTGCDQIGVLPRELDKDGKRQNAEWFDVQRLEVAEAEPLKLDNEKPGSDERLPTVRLGGLTRGAGRQTIVSMKLIDRLRRRLPAAFLLALLAVSMAIPACATTGSPVLTKVESAVDCSAGQVKAQLPNIITDVTTDLLSANYIKLLVDLAKRVGDDVVVCAVAAASSEAHARLASATAAQPNADRILDHAESYLSARGVTFASPPPPL